MKMELRASTHHLVEATWEDGEAFIGNSNECVAWTHTALYNDTAIRVSKVFTVVASVLGGMCWLMTGWSLLFDQVKALPRISSVAASATGTMTLLFFSSYDHEMCQADSLPCQWGAVSYLCVTGATFWLVYGVAMGLSIKPATRRTNTPQGCRSHSRSNQICL